MKYGRFMRVAGGWEALQRVLRAADGGGAHGTTCRSPTWPARYILEQPGVAGVIIGARLGEREHIADNRASVLVLARPTTIARSCRRRSRRCTRFPATAATSTAGRRFSRRQAI